MNFHTKHCSGPLLFSVAAHFVYTTKTQIKTPDCNSKVIPTHHHHHHRHCQNRLHLRKVHDSVGFGQALPHYYYYFHHQRRRRRRHRHRHRHHYYYYYYYYYYYVLNAMDSGSTWFGLSVHCPDQ